MDRTLTAVLVAALAVVGTAAPLAAADLGGGAPGAAATEEVGPGAHLAGVVGRQNASLNGEVERRALGVRLRAADTAREKAAVVAAQSASLEERLDRLQERKQTLTDRHENGTLAEGEYRAKMAVLAREIRSLQRLANTTAATTRDLPAEALAAHGVNATAVETLRSRARDLTGPEVAAVAGTIAGGPSATERATRRVRVAERRVGRAAERVDRAQGRVSGETLATARDRLSEARSALEAARDALEAGNATLALRRAGEARDLASAAADAVRGSDTTASGENGPPGDGGAANRTTGSPGGTANGANATTGSGTAESSAGAGGSERGRDRTTTGDRGTAAATTGGGERGPETATRTTTTAG